VSTLDVLRAVSFGQRVAEDEGDNLAAYFVETDQWRQAYSDQVDIIYGPKGAGKSALYFLLIAKQTELFDRGILLCPAENPRGAPAFKALVSDPPTSEPEFIALWKLYLLCVLSDKMEEFGIRNSEADSLRKCLSDTGLVTKGRSFQSILQSVYGYVRRIARPSALENTITLDPATQLPSGFTSKIVFAEPGDTERKQGFHSVDELLEIADRALQVESTRVWVLLDRLDVAFSESQLLEENALRALFRVYLDLLRYKNLKLKLFLRTDIWTRITSKGFREASHITKSLTIDWNQASLVNLVVRRAMQNPSLVAHYSANPKDVLASPDNQTSFLSRIFPDQVELGPRKPATFDWLLSRTRDGTRKNAPRELIHFLNTLRDVQVRRLEIGDPEPEDGHLFVRAAFKEALPDVSRVRLEQTLYAEYPDAKQYVEKFKNQKTQHTLDSLRGIWKLSAQATHETAKNLVDIGFFEQRGSNDEPVYWVPPLYRDALEMVQGAAE
jgi:hypothetical protein